MLKKKILFDDVFFNVANTGIARVWRSIFTHLSVNPHLVPAEYEFIILNRSDQLSNLGFRTINFPQYDFWLPNMDRTLLTELAKSEQIDLVVSSYYTFAMGIPSLMPVYDLIPERMGFHRESRGWLERELGFLSAEFFLTISESSKRDLMEFYPGIDSERIYVAYPGVDTSVFKPSSEDDRETFKAKHNLRDFLVMVGSRKGYKNGEILFSAIQQGGCKDFDLVLVGGDELSTKEKNIASRAEVNVIHLNFNDRDLANCLSAAKAMIYPSLYEGFGLPPLEALACGTPVIVTGDSSLPEAVGDLGLFMDGKSVDTLIRKISESQDPGWKRKIEIEGPLWAQKFSWDTMTSEFIKFVTKTFDCVPHAKDGTIEDYIDRYTRLLNLYQR